MSRAVRILKPAQDEKDLEETTRRLFRSDRLNPGELTTLAAEYITYQRSQPIANFHGLRDYYALVKGLGGDGELTLAVMRSSLARNFGGANDGTEGLYERFFPNAQKRRLCGGDSTKFPTALECIKSNL